MLVISDLQTVVNYDARAIGNVDPTYSNYEYQSACSMILQTDVVTARTLAHLARVCALRGKVDVAIPMYERIIRIHEALPAASNSDHAIALCELARLQEDSGSQEDAGVLHFKADEIMTELKARTQTTQAKEDTPGSGGGDESSSEDGEEGGDTDEGQSTCSDGSEDNSTPPKGLITRDGVHNATDST